MNKYNITGYVCSCTASTAPPTDGMSTRPSSRAPWSGRRPHPSPSPAQVTALLGRQSSDLHTFRRSRVQPRPQARPGCSVQVPRPVRGAGAGHGGGGPRGQGEWSHVATRDIDTWHADTTSRLMYRCIVYWEDTGAETSGVYSKELETKVQSFYIHREGPYKRVV